MLTFGQASCLVLGLLLNKENRRKATLTMTEMNMVSIYINGADPDTPTSVATVVQQRNPIKFCKYPPTDPDTDLSYQQPQIILESSSSSSCSSDNSSTPVKITKETVLNYLKSILSVQQPANSEMYERVFITSEVQHNLLKEHFGNITNRSKTVMKWVNSDTYFGDITTSRIDGMPSRGRWCFKLLNIYIDHLLKPNSKLYKHHIKQNVMKTIGYVRKSKTNENDKHRLMLLQKMIDKLYSKYYCSKIFVSPFSDSHQKIGKRDKEDTDYIINSLINCHGNTQDFIHRLKSNVQPTRLVIIDYAGLSTSPLDVKHFFRKYTQIKELVIDHGSNFELINRSDLIHGDSYIKKFNCRTGNVKRSI